MTVSHLVADHIHKVHFGKNWTYVWADEELSDITHKEASTAIYDCNTIATLVYHLIYYMERMIPALEEGLLEMNDKDSFLTPSIRNEEEWKALVQRLYKAARHFEERVRMIPNHLWEQAFIEKNNSSYYHLIQGIVEHTHYHLGQIVLLKKIIRSQKEGK